MRRRTFLRVGTTAGIATVAGCGGFGLGDDDGDDADEPPKLPVEPDYRNWFDGVSNYGRTHDRRGEESVRVRVGVEANLGYLGFGPAAVAVTPGTEVIWEWTGRGGSHNVVSSTDVFDSGRPVDSESKTFGHRFEAPRIYRYVCVPHRSAGMRGAVFVTPGTRAGTPAGE